MAELVPVELGDGVTAWVQASESAPAPGRPRIQEAGAEEVVARAIDIGLQVTESIRGFCRRIATSLHELDAAVRPSKATAAFGLNISAEGNVYVVKGTADATITITAEWEWEPSTGEPDE